MIQAKKLVYPLNRNQSASHCKKLNMTATIKAPTLLDAAHIPWQSVLILVGKILAGIKNAATL
jgi:hypothetical protein